MDMMLEINTKHAWICNTCGREITSVIAINNLVAAGLPTEIPCVYCDGTMQRQAPCLQDEFPTHYWTWDDPDRWLILKPFYTPYELPTPEQRHVLYIKIAFGGNTYINVWQVMYVQVHRQNPAHSAVYMQDGETWFEVDESIESLSGRIGRKMLGND